MRKGLLAILAVATVASGAPAWAHHSFAMFDRDKQVTVHGTVREFQWTNPHSWLQLTAHDAGGQTAEWSLEALSPNVLSRMGWKRNSIKTGDEVTVVFNPTRDGTHGGNLVSVVLANGQKIGGVQ